MSGYRPRYTCLTSPQWRKQRPSRGGVALAACRQTAGQRPWRRALFHQRSHRRWCFQTETESGPHQSEIRTRMSRDSYGRLSRSNHWRLPTTIWQQSISREHQQVPAKGEDFQKQPVLVLYPVANPPLILQQKTATEPEQLHLPVH